MPCDNINRQGKFECSGEGRRGEGGEGGGGKGREDESNLPFLCIFIQATLSL